MQRIIRETARLKDLIQAAQNKGDTPLAAKYAHELANLLATTTDGRAAPPSK